MLSRNRLCLLDGQIRQKSPDLVFDLNCFKSMLDIIAFLGSAISFFIWVAEVPRINYLLPVVLFFTGSAMFCVFIVLQILSLLFLCKNFLPILRNSISWWKYLFPVEKNYFIMGTIHSNQLMMSFVWREFSSMRWKMMKEDPGVSSAQSWGWPHAPQEIFKETQASKLGDAPVHPLLYQQSSSRPSPCYIFITSYDMCYA